MTSPTSDRSSAMLLRRLCMFEIDEGADIWHEIKARCIAISGSDVPEGSMRAQVFLPSFSNVPGHT